MIYALILVQFQLSFTIDVIFNENSTWIGEFITSSNITYLITPNGNGQVQYYYYIQVQLDFINPKFMLLAQKQQPVSNPFSPFLIDGYNVDATNQYQNQLIRFLKISSISDNIYISTIGNVEGQKFKIKILKTQNSKICQNDCSEQGICEEQGCQCNLNYIGIDCSYKATPIIDGQYLKDNFNGDIYIAFLYLNISMYQGKQLILKFKTNHYYGFQILFYKTSAIIYPKDEFIQNPNLCDTFQVNKYQDLELLLIIPESVKQNQNFNFAVKSIYPYFQLLDLFINLEEYSQEDDDKYNSIIIITTTVSSFCFVLLLVFCGYKYYSKQQPQIPINPAALENRPIENFNQQIELQENQQKNGLFLPCQKEINAEEYCSICLENFNLPQNIRQTRCHHNFHAECINLWLEKAKNECPICRQQLEIKQDHQVLRT
ncbi:unnamed protein product [Paramecium sonneborni]|uniref:RING-type domain-containing protein n=1 Tax=Paramecium sonneborni TaxID=65129 RepID=A0A8S1PEL6_9CILI|nr:unnamed protein product [Paramecium sonneborni]